MNRTETEADISPVLSTAGLGAVLTYSTTGHNKPCGQTIGANGAGDFAILIYGTPEEAWELARDHLKRLERSGYKIDEALIVPNYEGYSGPFITTAQAPNANMREATPNGGASLSMDGLGSD